MPISGLMTNSLKPSEEKLARDYDANFFQMHVGWRNEYVAIAEILNANINFKTVVDLGCGNRYILTRLEELGKRVLGIDGSPTVLKFDHRVKIMDLTQPIDVGKFDLVICTEVAEHIDEKFADIVVDNVANAAKETIWFSAARAGFGGHLHLNEQEPGYWQQKFAVRGFVKDELLSEDIRAQLLRRTRRVWWFAANSFAMVRSA